MVRKSKPKPGEDARDRKEDARRAAQSAPFTQSETREAIRKLESLQELRSRHRSGRSSPGRRRSSRDAKMQNEYEQRVSPNE